MYYRNAPKEQRQSYHSNWYFFTLLSLFILLLGGGCKFCDWIRKQSEFRNDESVMRLVNTGRFGSLVEYLSDIFFPAPSTADIKSYHKKEEKKHEVEVFRNR